MDGTDILNNALLHVFNVHAAHEEKNVSMTAADAYMYLVSL